MPGMRAMVIAQPGSRFAVEERAVRARGARGSNFACTPAASVHSDRWSCRATCRDWYTRIPGTR